MEELDILRFVIGVSFLAYGSVSDLRTRRVSDVIWIIMGVLAIFLLEAQLLMGDYTVHHHLILVPIAIMYFDVFWDRDPITEDEASWRRAVVVIIYLVALLVLVFQLYHFWQIGGESLTKFLQLLTIPIMILVAYAFYTVGLLRGGADAKAFMVIALLVPIYPEFYGFPLIGWIEPGFSILFPFAFVALLNAALILVLAPLAFLVYNMSKGRMKFPEGLFGYEAETRRLPKFVWLMQRIEDGELVRELLPRRSRKIEEEAEKLAAAGYDRVWVTPQIPFLVPLTVSFAVSFLIGNLFFGLLSIFG